jgi:hypothetical protein
LGIGAGFGCGDGSGCGPGLGIGAGFGCGDGIGPGLGIGAGFGCGDGIGPGFGIGAGFGCGDGIGPGLGIGAGFGCGDGIGNGCGTGSGSGNGFGSFGVFPSGANQRVRPAGAPDDGVVVALASDAASDGAVCLPDEGVATAPLPASVPATTVETAVAVDREALATLCELPGDPKEARGL